MDAIDLRSRLCGRRTLTLASVALAALLAVSCDTTGSPATVDATPGSAPPPGATADAAPGQIPGPDANASQSNWPDSNAEAVPCQPIAGGTDYSVGPGQPYASISDVPWENLGPGATVRIHWRAQPYHEKILISGQGTAALPIVVCGIPGPSGQLPVISGVNAHTRPGLAYGDPVLEDYSLILVYRRSYTESPSHITIENLNITGAQNQYSFTSTTGETRPYSRAAACIRVQEGDDISIINNKITDCGNGLFVLSKPDTASALSRNILIDGNYFKDNGIVGSDHQHSLYVQAIGVVYQYNYFGPLRRGALGGNVKDRSAGTVIRYNWIDGGKRQLDLVEAQDYGTWVIEQAYINSLHGAAPDPQRLALVRRYEKMYRTSYVYGNIIETADPESGGLLVHYGYDSVPRYTRKGTLYFYNNTVRVISDQSDQWNVRLFDLSTPDEKVDCLNNIITMSSRTPGSTPSHFTLTRYSGVVNFGVNWITAGWGKGGGTLNGVGNLLPTAGKPSPLDPQTLAPRPGSLAIDAAKPLPGAIPQQYRVTREYVRDQKSVRRTIHGSAPDLGAIEAP